MTMNEALALDLLLRWLVGAPRSDLPITEEDAACAAADLANSAHLVFRGTLTREQIREHWLSTTAAYNKAQVSGNALGGDRMPQEETVRLKSAAQAEIAEHVTRLLATPEARAMVVLYDRIARLDRKEAANE
jgi:hypothetical protein